MMEQGSVRNLEQIQEEEEGARVPRGVTAVLVAFGGAAVLFAGISLARTAPQEPLQKADPLGDLVAAKTRGAKPPPKVPDLSAKDVTFPGLLSDGDRPTTALAAAKVAPSVAEEPPAPPPPTDKLPVVPLPANHVLQATPVVTKPKDPLTKAAAGAAQISEPSAPTAPSGHDGGYQLQVSSFRTQAEAEQFSEQLRARGHRSYVQEANVPGRGTWYRVRIGPFPTQAAAAQYRIGFEGKEHVVPFVVPPKDVKDPKEPAKAGKKSR
jgi:cell division septation protein DedD